MGFEEGKSESNSTQKEAESNGEETQIDITKVCHEISSWNLQGSISWQVLWFTYFLKWGASMGVFPNYNSQKKRKKKKKVWCTLSSFLLHFCDTCKTSWLKQNDQSLGW